MEPIAQQNLHLLDTKEGLPALSGHRFKRNESGTTAVFFAMTFSVAMLAAAVAIDYGMASSDRAQLQAAIDAAALAGSDMLGLPDGEARGAERARAFFLANSDSVNQDKFGNVQLDTASGEVRIDAGGGFFTSLLSGFGIKSIPISANTKVAKGGGKVEIALVLDNSGSMAGQPIEDLRVAARNLVNVMFSGNEDGERVHFGVVPFAGMVNVGSENAGSSWLDGDGLSPIHNENFAESRNRFTLYGSMGVNWGGCVEARPAPYDVDDTAPDSGTPATLFVPSFAPDEPDTGNASGSSYYNNYLDDAGGACAPLTRTCTRYSRRGNCTNWVTQTLSPSQAQSRTCKYQGGNADTSAAYGTQKGPNMLCDSSPILPLTSTKSSIEFAINTMQAKGGTNIPEGIMWGWRVLSPGAPFSEGRSYSEENNTKYMIVMSDGANWHGAISNHNTSWYTANGYASKNRLGTGLTSTTQLKNAMNAKTAAACQNAKDAGIVIYTIAFNLSDTVTTNLLRACASGNDKALTASGGAGLAATFEQIGRNISKLRIAG